MQQYYYHHSMLPGGRRSHPRTAKFHRQSLLALANHNALEFYRQLPHGLSLHARFPFPANIAALLVLPSLHHDSDFFLLVDPQGRWLLWQDSPQAASEQQYELTRNELYGSPGEEGELQSGERHSFDVHDTKGKVLLSVGGAIVVMEYVISRQGIKLEEAVRNDNPYLKYRQVGWVGDQIGIVEEQEEKTFLHLHILEGAKLAPKPAFSQEYTNLREFKSIGKHLLIRTDSSVALLTDKHSPLATHPVRDPDGRLVELAQGQYGYFGSELLIFDQKKIVSFGGLSYMGKNLLEDRGISEVELLRQEEDGGKLVAITTLTHEVILAVLYENKWRLYHRLAGNTPTFSLHLTPNPHVLLAVTSSILDYYRLVAIETHRSLPHTRTLTLPSPLQQLQTLSSGKFILVGCQHANLLLRFDSEAQQYNRWLTLPSEPILAINDSHLATEGGLYSLNAQEQQIHQLTADQFVLASAGPTCIMTLNSKGQVALLTSTSTSPVILRQNAEHEYCWCLVENGCTVVACLSDLSNLKMINGSGESREIELRERTLVSALSGLWGEGLLAVGYVNGKLHVYREDQLVAQFDHHSSQPIRFFSAGQNRLGVATPDQQFLLTASASTFRLDKLELSSQERLLAAVAYLPLSDEFMMTELGQGQEVARLMSGASVGISAAASACQQGSYRMRVLSEDREDIPVVLVVGTIAYVGLKECVRAYDWKSGDILAERRNYLRDVIGIQLMQSGILVYGIDQLERNILLVLGEGDLELKATINLIQKDSKYIKAIEVIPGTDRFLCRGDRFTTLYELSDIQEPTLIHELKTELPGFSLSVGPDTIFAETDSYRLVVLYTSEPSLLPIARHLSDHEVIDVALLSRCMLTGNRAGYISVHEYNFQNENEALRMNLTQVAHLKISEEVTTLSAVSSTRAYYGCLSGAVGSVSLISQSQFEVLSKAERAGLQELSKEGHLSYQGWRRRKGESDKLIDSTLIRVFMVSRKGKILSKEEQEEYSQVCGLFQMLSM